MDLKNWVNRLHLFRVVRALGGHAGDGDSLDVAYRYHSSEELLDFFRFLGLEPVVYTEKPPQPEVGVPYPGDVYDQFPFLVQGTEWIEQPSHCTIAGQAVFIYAHGGEVTLGVHDGFEITDAAVARAELLEKLLEKAPLERIEPPVDSRRCICPKHHPEYFE